MNTYKFEIDRKCTIWYREYHEIEAENMEEAEKLIKENNISGNTDNSFIYQESLDDTLNDTGKFEILNSETGETILKNV